jgi:hypothetical protein
MPDVCSVDSHWIWHCLALQQTAKCLSEAENVTEFRLLEHSLSQELINLQGDQNVSVHLMITVQKTHCIRTIPTQLMI